MKMNAVGAISKLLKDLEIEFELKEEQNSIIKAIINREDDFCRFTHADNPKVTRHTRQIWWNLLRSGEIFQLFLNKHV